MARDALIGAARDYLKDKTDSGEWVAHVLTRTRATGESSCPNCNATATVHAPGNLPEIAAIVVCKTCEHITVFRAIP